MNSSCTPAATNFESRPTIAGTACLRCRSRTRAATGLRARWPARSRAAASPGRSGAIIVASTSRICASLAASSPKTSSPSLRDTASAAAVVLDSVCSSRVASEAAVGIASPGRTFALRRDRLRRRRRVVEAPGDTLGPGRRLQRLAFGEDVPREAGACPRAGRPRSASATAGRAAHGCRRSGWPGRASPGSARPPRRSRRAR